MRQRAFGLALEIDPAIELPGLGYAGTTAAIARPSPPPPPAGARSARVRLDPDELERRWGAGDGAELVRELRDGGQLLLSVERRPGCGYLMCAPGFARILVSADGGELLCAPLREDGDWAMLLPAQALPLAATLQGLEVLHAAGLVLARRAALLAGPPGAGKSSLAAALLARGAGLLSDDAVALSFEEGGLVAHPGAALLHLRGCEHERLAEAERARLGRSTPFLAKRRYEPATAAACPFGWLFLLERAAAGAPLERLERVDPFALLAQTYNLSVRTPERLARHLDLAAALAASGNVYRLRVLPHMDATALAALVHEELAGA
ncbi:MAG TPA: hypothetical protein VL979_13775 [Solirubrobacteraceae bacterium]|nr:hypothetical protein [Solirubrobacteraceae bacterium]